VIWLRAGLLAAIAGLLVLVIQAAPASEAPSEAAPQPTTAPLPTPPPTRVPLPTVPPQMVISRIARETPTPRAAATASAEPRVSLVDNGYVPAQFVVRLGASVTWVNSGNDGHDVTGNGPGGAWRSGPLAPSERYQRQFPLAGTYDYACSIHPEMRGRLVVQP
jgi:plastocyanin